MGIFISPIKFVNMVKDLITNPKKLKQYPTAWYFSCEGKQAYDAACTLPDKILYFHKYLLSLTGDDIRDISAEENMNIYKIACIMADTMDCATLPFSGWPNILSPELNPLVQFIVKHSGAPKYISTAEELLSILHRTTDTVSQTTPQNQLTMLNKENSAMYLIEREIIWSFSNNESGCIYPYTLKL